MIESVTIQNYKSIADLTLELGRFNVLIGENGCGKSNVLEALAFAAEGLSGRVAHEALFNRGVRVARPEITASAFRGAEDLTPVTIGLLFCRTDNAAGVGPLSLKLKPETRSPTTDWLGESSFRHERQAVPTVADRIAEYLRSSGTASLAAVDPHTLQSKLSRFAQEFATEYHTWLDSLWQPLRDYVVFSSVTPSLRGTDVISRRAPLGIHGEGLDVLLANLPPDDLAELQRRAQCISWLGELVVDREDALKFEGHKLGRSVSRLYFRDRFMGEGRDVFSAENTNEGVLHVLFHLALFIAPGLPDIFGVDNIDTALNPRLCRELTREMAGLAKARGRQAIVTTHNPATLDGLNLHDDDQRLFVVSRDDEGHTVAKRVRLKPQLNGDTKFKLSELWMRGHLGGLPAHF